jgi:hypothetical protein
MTSRRDLVYRLRADGSELSTELDKSRAGFSKLADDARRQLAVVATAAAGAATALGELTRRAIDNIDAMGKKALAMGTAVSNMGALKLAADLGRTSIERMERSFFRLAAEVDGGGSKLARYGVAVRNAAGELRDTFDVFADFADHIQSLGPGAEATATAMDVFGRSGAELLPVLLDGSAGLAEMRAEADRLGLTIEDKTAVAASRFNDRLDVMRSALRGVFIQVASNVLPALANYAEAVSEAATETNRMRSISDGLSWVMKGLISMVEGVVATFRIFSNTLGAVLASIVRGVQDVWNVLTTTVGSMGAMMGALIRRDFDGARSALDAGRSSIDEAMESFAANQLALWRTYGSDVEKIIWDTGHRLESLWSDNFEEIESTTRSFRPRIVEEVRQLGEEAATAYTDELSKAFDDALRENERFWSALEAEGARVFARTRTPLENYRIELERLSELLRYGVIDADTYLRATKELGAQFRSTAEDVSVAAAEMNRLGTTVAGEIYRGFETALFDPFNVSLEAMVTNFMQAIGRMALRAAAFQAFGAAAGVPAVGFASGGFVSGPGSATSDSIPARLSNGEFVVRAAAVQKYGLGLMSAINGLNYPRKGFASGGPVQAEPSSQSVSVVNVFDDRELERYLMSRRGERVIMNVMRRNRL